MSNEVTHNDQGLAIVELSVSPRLYRS